ncbi:MAG: hypothetical protein BGN94_24690 [Rhizobiales bacterium 68-8]|nr:MAG: hypothetical protein BGN94_24690 [Rhizobiales bacterium 68-8]
MDNPGEAERTRRREDDADQRERDDLAAQQSMAESTQRIVVISWWQLGLATGGTLLVFGSLAAAFNANRIAREIGRDQSRAYLHMNSAEFTWGNEQGGHPIIVLTVKNTGQTPAKWFAVRYKVFVKALADDSTLPNSGYDFSTLTFTGKQFRRWNALGASSERTLPCWDEKEAAEVSAIYKNRLRHSVEIAGVLRYETFFGEIFETEFWFARRKPGGYSVADITETEVPHKMQHARAVLRTYEQVGSRKHPPRD